MLPHEHDMERDKAGTVMSEAIRAVTCECKGSTAMLQTVQVIHTITRDGMLTAGLPTTIRPEFTLPFIVLIASRG